MKIYIYEYHWVFIMCECMYIFLMLCVRSTLSLLMLTQLHKIMCPWDSSVQVDVFHTEFFIPSEGKV